MSTPAVEARLASPIDLAGFRAESLQLLAHQVPPEAVHWLVPDADGDTQPEAALASQARYEPRAVDAIVPASFQRLCELVVLHREPERFALLYRLLWRLVHEPLLRTDPLDADMLHAQHMGHAVRRDMLKLKTHLRLRPVQDAVGGDAQMSWQRPTHHIVEAVAPWLAQRVAAPHWALFTPDRSVRCDLASLTYGAGLPLAEAPPYDGTDAAWLQCHARVFGGLKRAAPAA